MLSCCGEHLEEKRIRKNLKKALRPSQEPYRILPEMPDQAHSKEAPQHPAGLRFDKLIDRLKAQPLNTLRAVVLRPVSVRSEQRSVLAEATHRHVGVLADFSKASIGSNLPPPSYGY